MNKFRSAILGGGNVAPSSPLVGAKRGAGAEGDKLDSIPIARDEGRTADHRDDDRHRLAGLDLEREVLERRCVESCGVAEADVAEG